LSLATPNAELKQIASFALKQQFLSRSGGSPNLKQLLGSYQISSVVEGIVSVNALTVPSQCFVNPQSVNGCGSTATEMGESGISRVQQSANRRAMER
jgi:hypothetical protein